MTLVLKDYVEFKELDAKIQENILNRAKSDTLTEISGSDVEEIRLIYGDEVADAVDKAWDKAEDMQTPWFFTEYLMDSELIRDFINEDAIQYAESYYWHKNGHVNIPKAHVEIAA